MTRSESRGSCVISSAYRHKIMRDRDIKLLIVTFITIVRFPLVLLFFIGAIIFSDYERTWLFVLSFSALVTSTITDIFDGALARKWNVETKFGAHADPLMDKLFYLSTWPLLVYISTRNGHIHHAVFLLIITVMFLARDQWVTFLRSIGATYNISGSANWAGKLRTSLNFPLICAIYFYEASPWKLIPFKLLLTFEILAIIVNALSLYIYSKKYWPYLRKSASIE